MTLADLLRDPLARSVVLVEAVPLSVALEQMSKPSDRGPRCLHCGDAFEADDVRAQVHAYCRAPRRLQLKRERNACARGAA